MGVGPPSRDRSQSSAWPASSWWKAFGDPQLDALEAQGLQTAPGLATARARIGAAEAAVANQAAQSGIKFASTAAISRQRLSENDLISSHLVNLGWFNQAYAALDVQTDFDWWGRERAGLAAAVDRSRVATAESRAAELMVTAAIASAYAGWQFDSQRHEFAMEASTLSRRRRALQASLVRQGIAAADSLDVLDLECAQAEDLVTLTGGSVYARRLTLAALLGVDPEDVRLQQRGSATVPFLTQPPDVGIGLMARRPDLIASRLRVEASVADLAQARAGFYPDMQLHALAGLSSVDLGRLPEMSSRVASFGAALYLPIFDARGVKARYGVRVAAMQKAVAEYNEQVVTAAAQVAYEVAAWEGLRYRRLYAQEQLAAALALQQSAAARSEAGVEDEASSLRAALEVLRQRDAMAQIEESIALSRVALVKALGGGFEPVDPAALGESLAAR